MFLDQACGVLIADGHGRRPLEMLLGVEKIESRIAALVDPEALHSAFDRHDVDADAISQIEHRIVSVPIVQQAA